MKIYTVETLKQYYDDFSVVIIKHGCYADKAKALERAKLEYENMCARYDDEMVRYSDEDCYEGKKSGKLYVVEDAENGYYLIAFGVRKDRQCHSVAVEEWELDDQQYEINDDKWFGKVRWCEEDLIGALKDQGLPVTENNIAKLSSLCDKHWFTDHMISAGWEYMYNVIDNEDGWDEWDE